MPVALVALWERFKDAHLARLTVLEQAATALLDDALESDLRHQAEAEAHKIAGSVGTFGFIEGSRLAREVECLLQGSAPLRKAEVLRLSELVVALRKELERSPAAPPVFTRPARSPRLLIISQDADLTERLAVEAAGCGIESTVATGLSAAAATVGGDPPDLIVLDLPSAGADAGLGLVRELADRAPPIPALVLAGADTLVDRVEVARSGGRGLLQKPVPAPRVMETAVRLLQQLRAPEAKVLAVDDDPQLLVLLQTLLEPQGLQVTPLADPARFWKVLEEVSPDLLILDVEMPRTSGIELARAVRNDPRWAALPVLFLTVHTDPDTVHQVFAAGADDFVSKPVAGPELLARIQNRLDRTRILRSVAEVDGLTGTASPRRLGEVAAQFLRMADRHHQPVCIGVLDLDNFKRVNAVYGRAAGDAVLRRVSEFLLRTFRGEDVVSRWGGDEFLVAMYGMDRADGVHRLAEVLEGLRQEEFTAADGSRIRVTFSAGVGQYPDDGADVDALVGAAEEALSRARAAGLDRVLPTGSDPSRDRPTESVDVVIVEDDETLAGLLLNGLQTRGCRTQWFRDGHTAADALAGPGNSLQARVVLLDVDLPGLDGISVLRRMARSDALDGTRVIMLTVHSREAEILTALELGAFDHVAKPFSLPVLMQRVRRALRA